jgi:hypothetical protein
MRINLHCHSKYSADNFLEPEELIERAIKINLDGVCFTELHSMIPLWPLERIRIPEGFYVFRGWDSSGENVFKTDGFDAIETHMVSTWRI